MGRIHKISNRAAFRLKTGHAGPRSRRADVYRRVIGERPRTAAIAGAVPRAGGSDSEGPFVLTDIAGRHFWTGAGWVPMARYPSPLDHLVPFLTCAEAEAEVRRLRVTNRYARVIVCPQE